MNTSTILTSAAVSLIVSLAVEYFAKPWLEARKDRIVQTYRSCRDLYARTRQASFNLERYKWLLHQANTSAPGHDLSRTYEAIESMETTLRGDIDDVDTLASQVKLDDETDTRLTHLYVHLEMILRIQHHNPPAQRPSTWYDGALNSIVGSSSQDGIEDMLLEVKVGAGKIVERQMGVAHRLRAIAATGITWLAQRRNQRNKTPTPLE